jgi:CRISPR-associated protein Csm4
MMQTQLLAVKLRFTSPLHLGRGSEELDRTETVYHSDSLKAALFSVGVKMFPSWSNANAYHEGFRISSCFPFSGNELFLPRPLMDQTILPVGVDEAVRAKKVKKIEYLSIPLFKEIINKGSLNIDIHQISPDGKFVFSGKASNVFKTEVQQRVHVPHWHDKDNQTRPFFSDRLYFEKDCGLYFILQCDDQQLKQQIFEALCALGERGIGTDRTVGNGFFTFNPDKDTMLLNWEIPQNPSQAISLGLYLPSFNELHEVIDLDNSYWHIIRRGGYIAGAANESLRHFLRNEIFLFTEGSCFAVSNFLKGKTVNLKPETTEISHPVYRDGQCLFYYIP